MSRTVMCLMSCGMHIGSVKFPNLYGNCNSLQLPQCPGSSTAAALSSAVPTSGTSATPKRAVRVGYTLSYMSAPSAEHTTMSRG